MLRYGRVSNTAYIVHIWLFGSKRAIAILEPSYDILSTEIYSSSLLEPFGGDKWYIPALHVFYNVTSTCLLSWQVNF